ncbi:type II secretion system protein [bacterium]|jgi:type II secretory pathway pseudopilin PulG|nr:type II secretion system protein [bacterium]
MRRFFRRGFYLLELVVLVGIISFLALVSVPRLGFIKSAMVRAEMDKLYSTFLYAQQLSIVENKQKTLTFDTQKNVYHFEGKTYPLPHKITFGVLPRVLGSPSNPNKVLKRGVSYAHKSVEFYPSGIVKPGMACLVDLSENYMCCISSSVAQVSYIRRYEYKGSWRQI